jgi:hypothetical protein
LQYVAQQVSRGSGFFDQIPREKIADEQDLAATSHDALEGPSTSRRAE